MTGLSGRLRSAAGQLRARTPKRLRIGFVVHTIDGGAGTERSVITQANALAALPEGHDVTLLSLLRTADRPHYEVDPRVTVTHLLDVRDPEAPRPLRRGVATPAQAATLAQREATLVPRRWDATYDGLTDVVLQEFLPTVDVDVLVTTIPELLAAVVQLAPPSVAVVHQEHRASSTRVYDMDALLTFAPRADVVASLTGSMNDWLAAQLRGAAPDMVVMPNPLPPTPAPRATLEEKVFVAAGRLSVEKRFEQMVDAFASIADELPDWRLRIWGEGPRRASLEALVRRRGLTGRVELPGSTDDMPTEWARGSVGLLTSRAEGFGLVLQEAMAAGVPVVSYDVPAGPREIITDGVDGYLVPPESRAGLAAAMRHLALDDDVRRTMGAAARLSAQQWSADTLALEWVEVFHRAVARRRDPLAPRKVLHGRTVGPIGKLAVGDSAVGITPVEARRTALEHAAGAARRAAAGATWCVLPPHGDDPTAVVVVPSHRRADFLTALVDAAPPVWLSLLEPEENGWPERRGTVEAMAEALRRSGSGALHLEPWPGRGGHRGLLAGQGVRVEFWQPDATGALIAPGPSRFGPRLPAETETVEAEVWGVGVRAIPATMLPTVHDTRVEVDVVYTWVDGDDPAWQAARAERLAGRTGAATTESSSGAARYRSRDELRWSMRSLHLFAPWVRRIHLVTAGQVPAWLDTSHEKIALVDHRDIFPADALPTFSSHAIESRLHHVPDLAEHFLYVNDDVMLGRPLRPELFFSAAGAFATFEALRPVGLPGSEELAYLHAAWNNQRLLRETFGVNLTHTMAHSPHPMRRSVLAEIEERFPVEHRATTYAPFRSETDLSLLSSFAQHYGLLTGAAFPATAEHAYVDLGHQNVQGQLRALRRRDLDFFCIADNHDSAFDEDAVSAMLTEAMEHQFPVAAPWEK
ncbi:stealth conserved region 3 domain-containing protein [Nocardioides daphniae]|uniref:Exopolysaccharide phosphotransferase n=1 Tax=Nocardioides daphniae TaxID=402297 RepID=A0A4P7UC50_9ACTN|nr:stealth conserved region 3 domain-containing protein [Nocardioides daphniae]QCC76549.1 glycosyltransferase [Nocardioides daphniae]GGD05468.1 exopolysaccharide phosphotransferase [Nocardioides daphniae]